MLKLNVMDRPGANTFAKADVATRLNRAVRSRRRQFKFQSLNDEWVRYGPIHSDCAGQHAFRLSCKTTRRDPRALILRARRINGNRVGDRRGPKLLKKLPASRAGQ